MKGFSKEKPQIQASKTHWVFSSSSQPPDSRKELVYPTSPAPYSRPESVDYNHQEAVGANTITELTFQKLFHSFRENLQTDFRHMMSEFKMDIQALVTRTEHIETKMAEFAASHNSLIDSHTVLEEEVHRLTNKFLDLEDRSRRNNIRLRGVPESIAPDQLNNFLTDLLAFTLPHRSSQDLSIDRKHRISKPC